MTGPAPAGSPLLLTGRLVLPDAVVPEGALVVEGTRIRFAGHARDLPAAWRSASLPEGWPAGATLLPGAVDVHCHGGAGGEFSADRDASATAARHHHRSGTTTLLGSLVSGTREALVAGVEPAQPWWPPATWPASTSRVRSSRTRGGARRTRPRSPTWTRRCSRRWSRRLPGAAPRTR